MLTILSGLPMDWFDQVLIERQEATPAGPPRRCRHGAPERAAGSSSACVMGSTIASSRRSRAQAWSARVRRPRRPAWSRSRSIRTRSSPTGPRGSTIRRVADAAGIDVHREVSTAGFGSDIAVARGTACSALLDRPECVLYLGYQGDTPVVSGLGWRTGRTIGVFSIATIESARRRGYGAAMTARVMVDGVAAGCDVAALQASEMGRPIYERLGFRTVVRYSAYTDPATDPPA